MPKELPFEPFPFITGSHEQTIAGSLFPTQKEPLSHNWRLLLPDNDELSLEVTVPNNWNKKNKTVVLLHGLCGSHKSPYLIRMANKLQRTGIKIVRMNMRGCGSGKGFAKHIYHGGQSEDFLEVIKALKKQAPESPITIIGFSLGGNIVLKLSGELGLLGPSYIEKVIAINPPIDLEDSIIKLGHPNNRIYEKYFIRLLKDDLYFRYKKFPDLQKIPLYEEMSFAAFNRSYIIPHFSFQSEKDYYTRCSSMHYVYDIKVPCKILLAKDDPIISSFDFSPYALPKNIDVYSTKKGGHMGYLGKPGQPGGFYWLDSVLMKWINEDIY